jgi:hypothetical protein
MRQVGPSAQRRNGLRKVGDLRLQRGDVGGFRAGRGQHVVDQEVHLGGELLAGQLHAGNEVGEVDADVTACCLPPAVKLMPARVVLTPMGTVSC